MSHANQATTPITVDAPEIEGRYAHLDGYTVGFETFKVDADPAPLFIGLPDDRCPCPHWGIVTSGRVTFRWADHEETYETGDAYFAPPGHLPFVTAGTTIVEFSPTEAHEATMAVLGQNMSAPAAGNTR